MKIKRRVNSVAGPDNSLAEDSCPDIFELDSGDFLIVGTNVTDEAEEQIEKIAGYESAVVVPRVILTSAKSNIPVE